MQVVPSWLTLSPASETFSALVARSPAMVVFRSPAQSNQHPAMPDGGQQPHHKRTGRPTVKAKHRHLQLRGDHVWRQRQADRVVHLAMTTDSAQAGAQRKPDGQRAPSASTGKHKPPSQPPEACLRSRKSHGSSPQSRSPQRRWTAGRPPCTSPAHSSRTPQKSEQATPPNQPQPTPMVRRLTAHATSPAESTWLLVRLP